MMGKWNFFVPPERINEQKTGKEKVPNKFLGWMSSLLKKKKDGPLSLNLSESDEVRETLKQEIASLPEDERAETESFLVAEVEKIEKKREGYYPEPGDEVFFNGSRGWYVSDARNGGELLEIRRSRKDPKGREVLEKNIARRDELSLPQEVRKDEPIEVQEEKIEEVTTPEFFADKFKLKEEVSFSGEPGWQVEGIADNQVEIGRIKKDFRGRDVYERKIVKDNELVGVAQHENLAFKVGESVSVNGESGWEISSMAGVDGKYLEVGKVRADKKGALVFERKIVGLKEVEKK